jgi:hypothetical protein
MVQLGRLIRLFLQAVGAIAIVISIGFFSLRNFSRDFSSGNWIDSNEQIIEAPHGLHTVKTFHRSSGPENFFLVYLSTGDPNQSDQYIEIVELRDVASGQASVTWDGTDRLLVKYPSSAKVVSAYAQTHDVRVILSPPLPTESSGEK